MSLFNLLQTWGKKVTCLFGETSEFEEHADHSSSVEAFFSNETLSSFLPYDVYDEEYGLFVNKHSMGFAIEMLPLVGGESNIQKDIQHIFDEILEENDSIQCLFWADHRIGSLLDFWEQPRSEKGGVYAKIAQRRLDNFKQPKGFSPVLFRFVFSYTVPFNSERDDYVSLAQKLQLKKEKCLRLFTSFSKSTKSWQASQLLEFVSGLIDYSTDVYAHPPLWNPYQNLASQLPKGGSLSIQDQQLTWETGKTHAPGEHLSFKSFRAVGFPDQWSLLHMHHLIGDIDRDSYRLLTPFYLHYSVHCPKQTSIVQKFWTRAKFAEKQGQSQRLIKLIPELEQELKEIQYARKELHQGARFVWTHLSAGIWGKPQDLMAAEQTLKAIFRHHDFTLAENTKIHFPHFLSLLPMTLAEHVKGLKNLQVFRTTLTKECSHFVPVQGEWYGTLKSPGILFTGKRGQLANWNPFDNDYGNYNTWVVGRSGGGKSVLMQELIFNGLSTGAKVFVLDVGRSFDKLCLTLEGQMMEFSHQSNICLNPFSNVPLNDSRGQEDCMVMLKSLFGNMADPFHGLNSEQNSRLEEGIKKVLIAKQNESTITDVASWLKNQEDSVARSIGTMLFPYTRQGIFGRYFDGKSNVDFHNPFVLIELEELKEKKDLQAIVLQMLMMTITDQAFLGDRKKRFYICFDEAWDLLRAKQTGPFIETLARRLRKYNGALIVGTQQIKDAYSSPGAEAAYANCDWKCFLPQDAESIALLKEKAEMPESKIKAIQNLTTAHGLYSEVMICQGKSYSTQRLWLDPFSSLLYSTQPADHERITTLRQTGLSLEEAMEQLLKERACQR